MKTRERLTSGKYSKIGGNMIHILICDDDTTFAHDMYKRILTLPAYSPKSMTIQCLTNANDINAELLTNCDILFLDIDLGEKNGNSCARSNSVCLASNLYIHHLFYILYRISNNIRLYFTTTRVVA